MAILKSNVGLKQRGKRSVIKYHLIRKRLQTKQNKGNHSTKINWMTTDETEVTKKQKDEDVGVKTIN